jgi:hypothetical protein
MTLLLSLVEAIQLAVVVVASVAAAVVAVVLVAEATLVLAVQFTTGRHGDRIGGFPNES